MDSNHDGQEKLETSDGASALTVNVASSTLEFSAVTNITGDFSIRVPSGFDYHLTTESIVVDRGSVPSFPLTTASLDLGNVYLQPT